MFYTTHANDPLPAAVGLTVLDAVLEEVWYRGRKLQEQSYKPGFIACRLCMAILAMSGEEV